MSDSAANPVCREMERLRGFRVTTRGDLRASRHVTREGPAYVLTDPLTGRSRLLTLDDYRLLTALHDGASLGEAFERLVACGELGAGDEERFYRFALTLHRDGIVSLPIDDTERMLTRGERLRVERRRRCVSSWIAIRVPLVAPERFLRRTLPLFGWMFTRGAFAGWMVLMVVAVSVAIASGGELVRPLLSLAWADNLGLLWLALVGLKVVHEFGHAYACKRLGGAVPEMGALFIAFTPFAYVDASSAWDFGRRRDRVIVSLAGLYFESIVGAVGLFVWASTAPGALNTLAYQVFLLALLVSIAFNLNPLLRYDGYFILSDLAGAPNLMERARRRVASRAQRFLFGVRRDDGEAVEGAGWWLAPFGVCALGYRVLVLAGICGLLILRFSAAGLALSVFLLALVLGATVYRLFRHLTRSAQLAPVRRRAILTGVVGVAGLVVATLAAPLPRSVHASGVFEPRLQTACRAEGSGFVDSIEAVDGQRVLAGATIVRLESAEAVERLALARAELGIVEAMERAAVRDQPARRDQAAQRRAYFSRKLREAQEAVDELACRVEADGDVYFLDDAIRRGAYVERGALLAVVGSRGWAASFYLRARDIAAIDLRVGDAVTCVPDVLGGRELSGCVTRISPVADREIADVGVTQFGGGSVAIDPLSEEAEEPYWRVWVTVEDPPSDIVPLGLGVEGRFGVASETIASQVRSTVDWLLARARAET